MDKKDGMLLTQQEAVMPFFKGVPPPWTEKSKINQCPGGQK